MRGEGSTAQYKNKRNLLVVVLPQIFIQTHQHLLIIGLWRILKSGLNEVGLNEILNDGIDRDSGNVQFRVITHCEPEKAVRF